MVMFAVVCLNYQNEFELYCYTSSESSAIIISHYLNVHYQEMYNYAVYHELLWK